MQAANQAFRLDDWTVTPDLGRIERGNDVRRIKPKSMEVLECLARARGAVVSRNELFDAVWPGLAVSDDVLTNSVVELRKAFGDSARDPKVIETIPKKGFRLVSEVAPADAAPAPGGKAVSPLAWAAVVFTLAVLAVAGTWFWGQDSTSTAASGKSIAVLPFVNMTGSAEKEYFADGLSEELINQLTQLDGLFVAGRTSSFYFKGRNEDLREVGQALSVDHVLEGSVRKANGQVRITAQLIDVNTGFHLWSDSYERPYDDIFAIQDEIANAVATALSVRLSVGEAASFPGLTTNVEAFNEYMLGNGIHKEFTAEAMMKGIRHFQNATRLDPGFALAWDRLANAYRTAWLTLGNDDGERWQRLADEAIDRAMTAAPNAWYVWQTAAYMAVDRQNWSEAHRLFDQLLSIKSDGGEHDSHAWLDLLGKVGKAEEAIRIKERVLLREPLHPDTTMYLGHLYLMQGRTDDALEQFEAGMQLQGYRSQLSHEAMITALASGQAELAASWLDTVIQYQQPGAKGVHEAMRDRFGNADSALAWLRNGFETESISDYYVIVWSSYYGDHDLVLAAMRRTPDLWAFWTPLTEPVRQTAEFKQILIDIGLADYYREYGWNDYCQPLGDLDFECR